LGNPLGLTCHYMTQTLQFLTLSVIPASFVAMLVYAWWRGGRRRAVIYRWSFTLGATAVWSSSILRFYGGGAFPYALIYYWGLVASYVFSLAAIGVLLTTLRHLNITGRMGKTAVGLSATFWLLAIALEPLFWPEFLPFTVWPGQPMRHFDLWAGAWIASWAIPLLGAWLLTAQVRKGLPVSLYRNQMRYWLLTLSLFAIGGGLTSVRQPGQPLWQESGVLVALLAALIGTISLTHWQLPDLKIAVRQMAYRLSGAVAVFALAWLSLTVVLQAIANLPADSDPDLTVILASAVIAALLMIVYRLVNQLARRLLLPAITHREKTLADYAEASGYFPETGRLGELFLHAVQATVGSDDAWLFLAEDGPGGVLRLRPLVTLTDQSLAEAEFSAQSSFGQLLRQQAGALLHYDLLSLPDNADQLSDREKETLEAWQRVLYFPVGSGRNLVGVAALGRKQSGEPYDSEDYADLTVLCAQAGPLLAQAQQMASLHQMNEYSFGLNQTLVWQNRQLRELVGLYNQYINLVSPELKRPFPPIQEKLQKLQENGADSQSKTLLANLGQDVAALRQPIEALIDMSARIQVRQPFIFTQVHLEELTQNAIHTLSTMAEARRVQVLYEPDDNLPTTLGDPHQLHEAIRHLLHNAIKFNKIGGQIRLYSGVQGGDLYLQIEDTGVGIPEERIGSIWDGLTGLSANGRSKRPGLGLALTQFIVAAHGGRLLASSQYGAGSVFTIFLPLVYQE
jgi:signal transduction histidine kinase